MRVAFYQFNPKLGKIDYNLKKIEKNLSQIKNGNLAGLFLAQRFPHETELAPLLQAINDSILIQFFQSIEDLPTSYHRC